MNKSVEFAFLLFAVGAASQLMYAAELERGIQEQIDATAANGGGKVVVPAGRHETKGPIRLRSNVELHLEKDAVVVFPARLESYLPAVRSSWEGIECMNFSPLVYAFGCTNFAKTQSRKPLPDKLPWTVIPLLPDWVEMLPTVGFAGWRDLIYSLPNQLKIMSMTARKAPVDVSSARKRTILVFLAAFMLTGFADEEVTLAYFHTSDLDSLLLAADELFGKNEILPLTMREMAEK